MDIQIQTIHFAPSEVLNENISNKLQRAFGPYPYITKARVFVKVQENEPENKFIIEVQLPLPHGELFAETRSGDPYKALNQTIEKLKKQLDKYKEKVYINP